MHTPVEMDAATRAQRFWQLAGHPQPNVLVLSHLYRLAPMLKDLRKLMPHSSLVAVEPDAEESAFWRGRLNGRLLERTRLSGHRDTQQASRLRHSDDATYVTLSGIARQAASWGTVALVLDCGGWEHEALQGVDTDTVQSLHWLNARVWLPGRGKDPGWRWLDRLASECGLALQGLHELDSAGKRADVVYTRPR